MVNIFSRSNSLFYFSSPDSDDTFGGDEPDEDFSGRDDQFLVSDRTENKFYGNETFLKYQIVLFCCSF